MRVVLDATPLLGRETGIGRYVRSLLTELPAALAERWPGAEVAVTTWSWRHHRVPDLPAGVSQTGPRAPARLLRTAWLRTDVPPVESLVGRLDVFHGTNFVAPPSRSGHTVVTVHDLTYEDHRDTVAARSLPYAVLVPRAIRRGAVVAVPSVAVGEQVRARYGVEDERVVVTPLGVDSAWASAAPLDEGGLRALGLPDRYVLFVGSLDPRKNLDRLVRAHAGLRSADPDTPDLVLAGPAGRAALRTDLPGVHRTGWLPDDLLRRVVASSRAVALPSLDEGFGLPVLEAFATGRPVVAGDVPALHEVGGTLARYADPSDVEAIAAALSDALAEADDIQGQAARRDRAAGYTWLACARTTVAAYRRALDA